MEQSQPNRVCQASADYVTFKCMPEAVDGKAEGGSAAIPPVPVAALADALDRLGHRSQAMHSSMRPVTIPGPILGPAFTIQAVPHPALSERPYEKELAAVDAIPAGAIVAVSAGGMTETGIWGELLSTRAQARGGLGVIVEGGVRDLAGMRQLGFTVFATAVHPADSYGRAEVISYGEPIICGGVAVNPGDLIAADVDGVVVIPTAVADQCISDATQKLEKEDRARVMLRDDGATVQETYERHGVL
jgi:4-hydroxy-4-methyl-2-oxoglutarate aldolase